MCRNMFWLVATITLLHAAEAPAQTIEWWDRSGESFSISPPLLPRMQQVKATPYGIFAAGQTDCENAMCKGLLTRYDADGGVVWRIYPELGELGTVISGVDADASGVYVHGTTRIRDPRPDGFHEAWDTSFVQKYDHDGTEVWRYVDWFDGPRGYRIKQFSGCAIALDETGIYTTTSQFPLVKAERRGCGHIVRKFSFDGQLLWLRDGGGALAVGDGKVFVDRATYSAAGEFLGNPAAPGQPTYQLDIARKGRAYHDGALYLCSLRSDRFQAGRGELSVYKTDLEGNVEWQVDYPKSVGPLSCAVDATPAGVYVTANLSFNPRGSFSPFGTSEYRPGLTVRRWDFAGAETAAWDFPSLSGPPHDFSWEEHEDLPHAISVLDDAVYLAGHDGGTNTGFVARVSGEPLLTPSVIGLDDGKRLAILDHQYGAGKVAALVGSADGSGVPREVSFSDGLRPIDFFGVEDLDGNGRPELAVLSRRPPALEVADSESGAGLLSLPLDADFDPVAALAVAGDSAVILAVLMKHRTKSYVRIEEFDARSGESLRSVPFNPAFLPLDAILLGSGAERRYAALMANPAPGSPGKLEIRDTQGSPAQNVWLGSRMTPVRALAYRDHTGAERIAVLRRNADLGWQDVAVVDPNAGAIVYTVAFTGQTTPAAFAGSDDVQGDLSPQFTVAGRAIDGSLKAETRELVSGALLHNVFLRRGQPAQDLIYLGPASGAVTPSLGILVPINSGPYTPHEQPFSVIVPYHRFGLVIVDLITGQTTGELIFPDDDLEIFHSAGSGFIGNFTWHDRNGDGIQDAADTGLAGVKVKLRSCGSDPRYEQTTFSDADGYYEFRDLQLRSYLVEFLAPAGAAYTTFQAGTDTALDSDAGPDGFSPCIDLEDDGSNRDDIDAGFVFPITPSQQ